MTKEASFLKSIADELAAIFEKMNLQEIEYQKDDVKLRLVKPAPRETILTQSPAAAFLPPPDSSAITTLSVAKTARSLQKATSEAHEMNQECAKDIITSPMIGTIYLAPDPNSPPFVKPGDAVQKGQTLLIVETMKVMNPIRADRGGIVKEVLVHNAQPVEFGEKLLILES